MYLRKTNKKDEVIKMNEYITTKGTSLYWHGRYDLVDGYELDVRRNRNSYAAGADLSQPNGAIQVKKPARLSNAQVLVELDAIAQYYNL